jgi:serine/threonine protein phosphatase PrpC
VVAVWSARCPGSQGANEDGAAVMPLGPDRAVLAVADGMGGVQGGERAAEIALRSVTQAVARAGPDEPTLRAAILDGVEKANEAVVSLGVGAATTLVVVEIDRDTIRPYHVGDSMVLVTGQKGKVKLQTVRHSPVGFAVESGQINESEAMRRADRHIVSNVVGDNTMRIEVGPTLAMARRDTLLLATDGLFDNLYTEEVVAVIRRGALGPAAGSLLAEAQERMTHPAPGHPAKPDDATFILYRRGR